ncbi:MAG TPA: septal ring lytic transglycosylase RlpA family protein, partial [Thermoanaerobaculia bacterium]|nr:septal ring lytic transglycosylase RlpA family protein [Thermoanaerobaculia bacterium]
MRTLTIRIAVLIAAFAVISPSALAQEPSGGATAPAAAPAPAPFRLSGGGGALLGKKVRFRGTVDAKLAGRPVVVQSFDPVTEAWTKQAKTTVKPDGTFLARWKARKIGQFRTRALIGGSARTAAASPELPLTVFRPAIATWYGPGFYGNKTACGIELTETLVGVAHRTLPCGTIVAVHYGSTTILAPVVDRGPFGGEAKWDLTKGAADL